MNVRIREVTTMYCKNKSKLTRELRHKLESELEKNIMVRDNQSENMSYFFSPYSTHFSRHLICAPLAFWSYIFTSSISIL
jgi:hypothetical protein